MVEKGRLYAKDSVTIASEEVVKCCTVYREAEYSDCDNDFCGNDELQPEWNVRDMVVRLSRVHD